jgi:hypothetical protein
MLQEPGTSRSARIGYSLGLATRVNEPFIFRLSEQSALILVVMLSVALWAGYLGCVRRRCICARVIAWAVRTKTKRRHTRSCRSLAAVYRSIFTSPGARQQALRYAQQKYTVFREVQLAPYPADDVRVTCETPARL